MGSRSPRCQQDTVMFDKRSSDAVDGRSTQGKFVALMDVNSIPSNAVQIGKDVYIGGMSQSQSQSPSNRNLFIGALTRGQGLEYVDVSNFKGFTSAQNCLIYCCDSIMKPVWKPCCEGSLPNSGNVTPLPLGKYNGSALFLGKNTNTGEIGTVFKHDGSYQCFVVGKSQHSQPCCPHPFKCFQVLQCFSAYEQIPEAPPDFEVLCKPR